MRSTESPNKCYRMMVDGSDVRGRFMVTYDVVARSYAEALELVGARAASEGWVVVTVDEVEELPSTAGTGTIRRVVGRAYFDNDDIAN